MIATIIVALITAVIGPMLVSWGKVKWNRKREKDTIPEAIEFTSAIDHQLEIMRQEMECDRIWIAQFHNGGYFYPTGKSIQKFSIFFERVSEDAKSIMGVFQGIPVSFFPRALKELNNEGRLFIESYDEGNNYDLDNLAREYGTKSLYMKSLYDLDDRFVGILALAYNTPYIFNEEDWNFVNHKAGTIGTLLDNYLKKKK